MDEAERELNRLEREEKMKHDLAVQRAQEELQMDKMKTQSDQDNNSFSYFNGSQANQSSLRDRDIELSRIDDMQRMDSMDNTKIGTKREIIDMIQQLEPDK